MFPHIDLKTPLTSDQASKVDKATVKQRNQLKNCFKNLLGSTKASQQSKAEATDIFQKLFYGERVKDVIAQKLEVTGEEVGRMNIQRIKDETCALYLAEPEEVKLKMREFAKTGKRDSKERATSGADTKEIWTSENAIKNIEMLVAVVNKFMAGLEKVTRWTYTLLAGGPSPELDGEIDTYSFHVGLTALGNDFSRAYPGFEKDVMGPFTDFVRRVQASKQKETVEGESMSSSSAAMDLSRLAEDKSPDDGSKDTSPHIDSGDTFPCDTQPPASNLEWFDGTASHTAENGAHDISMGLSMHGHASQHSSDAAHISASQFPSGILNAAHGLSEGVISQGSPTFDTLSQNNISPSQDAFSSLVLDTSFSSQDPSFGLVPDAPYSFDCDDFFWLSDDFDKYLASLGGDDRTYGNPDLPTHPSIPAYPALPPISPPCARRFLNIQNIVVAPPLPSLSASLSHPVPTPLATPSTTPPALETVCANDTIAPVPIGSPVSLDNSPTTEPLAAPSLCATQLSPPSPVATVCVDQGDKSPI
ncbi:hypothetical protein JVT61DRAFT_10384 [Boletus reticuloceps]|uniref:Uncharacterized protein n=1 Tax=Boletus reticuloceps TaxID=495285 RepID=A0A8I3AEW5_9AGAM|nr:hypothetical protein JVT61DRAFT_10384 [Boletus reticuloceps]